MGDTNTIPQMCVTTGLRTTGVSQPPVLRTRPLLPPDQPDLTGWKGPLPHPSWQHSNPGPIPPHAPSPSSPATGGLTSQEGQHGPPPGQPGTSHSRDHSPRRNHQLGGGGGESSEARAEARLDLCFLYPLACTTLGPVRFMKNISRSLPSLAGESPGFSKDGVRGSSLGHD